MPKYYELTGDLRQQALAILKQRVEQKELIHRTAKLLGCDGFVTSGIFQSHVFGFTAKKPPTDPRLRPHYDRAKRTHTDIYVPNRSTKEGRLLDRELRQLALGGPAEIAKLVGMSIWGSDLSYRLPGIQCFPRPFQRVDRIILEVPDEVTLKVGKRISDLTVEVLEAKQTLFNKKARDAKLKKRRAARKRKGSA